MPTSRNILSIRLNDEEKVILQSAAADERTTMSDYVRRQAIEAAELRIMERRVVTIPAEAWENFEAWCHAPAKEIPALVKLAGRKPAWED